MPTHQCMRTTTLSGLVIGMAGGLARLSSTHHHLALGGLNVFDVLEKLGGHPATASLHALDASSTSCKPVLQSFCGSPLSRSWSRSRSRMHFQPALAFCNPFLCNLEKGSEKKRNDRQPGVLPVRGTLCSQASKLPLLPCYALCSTLLCSSLLYLLR